jgi:hypothetical protein
MLLNNYPKLLSDAGFDLLKGDFSAAHHRQGKKYRSENGGSTGEPPL